MRFSAMLMLLTLLSLPTNVAAQAFKVPVTTATPPVIRKENGASLQKAPSADAIEKKTAGQTFVIPGQTTETVEKKKTEDAPRQDSHANDMTPAEQWLTVKGRDLLTVLSDKNSQKRRDNLLSMADQVFKKTEMARLAMGRYWNELSDEQKTRYVDLFVPYFVATYGSIRIPIEDVSFRMGGTVPSGKDLIVKTQVDMRSQADIAAKKAARAQGIDDPTSDGSTMEIFFAVRPTDDGFYIRDVNVMGKSMLLFLRDQVGNMYSTAHDGFLDQMNERIKKENDRIALMSQFNKS